MRVLHVCPYMHPSAGGPPVVVERLCSLMPSQSWEAEVIATSLYCDDDGSALQQELRKRINVSVLPIRGPRLFKRAPGAGEAIDHAVRGADIVHLHTLWHPLNSLARKACESHGRRYVLMPHGMLDPYSLGQRQWRKRAYLAIYERRNLRGAARLVFTTVEEQEAAVRKLPWLPPGEVVPLASDGLPPEFAKDTGAALFEEFFPEAIGRQVILFLGRLHPKKGLDRILEALALVVRDHPSALLVIVGDGDEGYVRTIRARVQRESLDGHALFTGSLAGNAKWAALARATVFVLPSRQENFAISVAEAMHMAVPVIVSDKVNSWPHVEKAGAGIVIPEGQIAQCLARNISEILSAPDRARECGQRGQDYAKEHFTWQRVARETAALYGRVLSQSSPR